MELFQVEITGYRKFKEKAVLKTRGKVLAILGANEAGKSSLLKALTHLNNNTPFEPHERSSGTDGETVEIKAKFALSDDDRIVAGTPLARWYSITKDANGVRKWSIDPWPADRDYSHRLKLQNEFRKFHENAKAASIIEEQDARLLSETSDFFGSIHERKKDLSDSQKQSMSDICERWHAVISQDSPKYLQSFATAFKKAEDIESSESARIKAGRILWDRLPEFLFFGGGDRHIKSSYAWAELNISVPDALSNLARIAELDLPRLIDCMNTNVTDPDNDNMIDKANAALIRNFREVWNQSKVSIVLAKSDQYLSVHVHNNQQERTALEQRSDGLKQFVVT